jgi:Domain of unknown function (DUF4340)
MKPKALIPLAILFAVLGALVLMKRAGHETVTLTEQAQLTTLVPEDLDTDAVGKLKIWSGASEDDAIILAKTGDDAWELESAYGAPVDTKKIDSFLHTVKTMEGEFRADASETQLADYQLSDDLGFHAVGYGADGTTEAFNVLVGKSPSFGNAFMRAGGSSAVYVVDLNLKREAAVYSDEATEKPKADHWLDKTILALNADDLTGLDLVFPDKHLAAEKETIVIEPETPATEESAADSDGDTDADAPVEPKTETRWKLTAGGIGQEPHQAPFSSITSRLAALDASTVVDPAKAADYGMAPPTYRLTITQEGKDDIVLNGGRPDLRGPAYLSVDGDEKGLIYQVTKLSFEDLFGKGTDYFEMPGLLLEDRALTSITYTWPEGHAELAKVDGEWQVNVPKADLPVDEAALETLERKVSAWQALDYADPGADTGLDAPTHTITFATADETHHIALGKDATHTDGRYAKLDDVPHTLVMPKTEIASIFAGPMGLYRTTLFDVEETEQGITYVELSRSDTSYILDKQNDGWYVVTDTESFLAEESAVAALLDSLMLLEADDFILDANRTPGETYATILFKTEKGAEYRATIETAGDDATYPATVAGHTSAYVLSNSWLNRVFPAVASLRPEPEENTTAEN